MYSLYLNKTYLNEHVKEALTRGAFLSMAIKAPAAFLSGKEGAKQMFKSTAAQQASLLGSKAMGKVTGVDLLPLAVKAKSNANLLDNVLNNTSSKRRNFLKQRTLDAALTHTPVGSATKSLVSIAPGAFANILKIIGRNLM